MFSLPPVAVDEDLGADDEMLAVGQDIAFIGLDVDAAALTQRSTTLPDRRRVRRHGFVVWRTLSDPFPAWATA